MSAEASAGLRGVIAGNSELSNVYGEEGRLIYRGFDIHDLAKHSTFEEIAYLFWYGKLPTRAELDAFSKEFAAQREIPDVVMQILRLTPKDAHPMDVVRTAVSALSYVDPLAVDDTTQPDKNIPRAIKITAQTPTIVAAFDRLRKGLEPIAPRQDLSFAANFLYMLKGEVPDEMVARAFDVALILHADHEFNASTFAARVTAATLADMHAAVTSAVAALKGPLHGGANAAVMASLIEIGEVDRVAPWVLEKLGRKERVMGFGHRVYKQGDPRSKWLREISRRLGERAGDTRYYEMSVKMEEVMQREKGLFPNVDFYAATVYYYLGIPTDLMTPVFATSRISGWTAHILEQYGDNRLIRPRAEYVGPVDQHYVPLDQRT